MNQVAEQHQTGFVALKGIDEPSLDNHLQQVVDAGMDVADDQWRQTIRQRHDAAGVAVGVPFPKGLVGENAVDPGDTLEGVVMLEGFERVAEQGCQAFQVSAPFFSELLRRVAFRQEADCAEPVGIEGLQGELAIPVGDFQVPAGDRFRIVENRCLDVVVAPKDDVVAGAYAQESG